MNQVIKKTSHMGSSMFANDYPVQSISGSVDSVVEEWKALTPLTRIDADGGWKAAGVDDLITGFLLAEHKQETVGWFKAPILVAGCLNQAMVPFDASLDTSNKQSFAVQAPLFVKQLNKV